MKKLFNYCVYRIAYTYKKMKMHDYIGQGYFLMFFAFTGYLLALTLFVLFQFGVGLNKLLIVLFCIPLFIEALEWIKEWWYIYRMEYYSAIKRNTVESVLMRWMNLESVIQSEVSQKEKDKYRILMHLYGI